uniref:Uncharacterized protein n=1 Tax=Meloidogyne incognita TaxID=6306 RepID=A0A914LS70_MELIC
MSIILDPYISPKEKNRLSGFNEEENENLVSLQENEKEVDQKISSTDSAVTTSTISPITNLKIIENKKENILNLNEISNKEESSRRKEKKGTTTTITSSSSSSRESSSSSRHTEPKRKPEDGKKKEGKSFGIFLNLNLGKDNCLFLISVWSVYFNFGKP